MCKGRLLTTPFAMSRILIAFLRECCPPLLEYYLGRENGFEGKADASLMRLLSHSMLAWGDDSRGKITEEARVLLCRSLQASDRTRRLTLEAMAASPCALTGDAAEEKLDLINMMVQVSLDGVDADVVVAAAGALPVRPADMALLIRGLLREADNSAHEDHPDRKVRI